MSEIKITSNGIKQAIDDLVNENEILQDKVYKLEEQLQQKENIIKEAREYIKKHSTTINFKTMRVDYNLIMNKLLEILDKEVN